MLKLWMLEAARYRKPLPQLDLDAAADWLAESYCKSRYDRCVGLGVELHVFPLLTWLK